MRSTPASGRPTRAAAARRWGTACISLSRMSGLGAVTPKLVFPVPLLPYTSALSRRCSGGALTSTASTLTLPLALGEQAELLRPGLGDQVADALLHPLRLLLERGGHLLALGARCLQLLPADLDHRQLEDLVLLRGVADVHRLREQRDLAG